MASASTVTPPLRKVGSWRALQIIIYLMAVAMSIGTLVAYKRLNSLFKRDMHMCILYATPSITVKDKPHDCEVSLEKSNNEHTCSFVYFNVICSVVYAIIGCWFFIACTSDAKTRPDETVQSWKLVIPSIFFAGVLTLLSIICSSLLTGGVADFTTSLSQQPLASTCQHFKLLRPENVTVFMHEVHLYKVVAELSTWLSTTVWLLAVVVLTCRCCVAADFVTTNTQLPPDNEMNEEASVMPSVTSQSSWTQVLQRFVSNINTSSLTRSRKPSLNDARSSTSVYRNLLCNGSLRGSNGLKSTADLPEGVFSLASSIPMVSYERSTSGAVSRQNNELNSIDRNSV